MSMELKQAALAAFANAFGAEPTLLAQAPGRVELLGNHTDYNGGLVLAAAINRYTTVVGRATPDRQGRAATADLGKTDAFAIDAIERGEEGSWVRYVRGVVW